MLRNKYVIAAVGIILMAVIGYNIRFFLSRGPVVSSRSQVQSVQKAAVTSQTDAPVSRHEAEKKDTRAWRMDPFSIPSSFTAVSPKQAEPEEDYSWVGGLRLSGIIQKEGRGYALIDGGVYGRNDSIRSAQILDIKKHSIVLLLGRRAYEIFLDEENGMKENPE